MLLEAGRTPRAYTPHRACKRVRAHRAARATPLVQRRSGSLRQSPFPFRSLTIGKRLAQRIRAYVTSGLTDQREVRSNLEWRLSPRVSVEGSYDNVNDISSSSLGNLGADVRWRLEFE
jgi:hypothetical protein